MEMDVRYTVEDAIRMAREKATRLTAFRKQQGIKINEQQLNGDTSQENDPWIVNAVRISKEAYALAKHPDTDRLYALCVERCGPPLDPTASGTELVLSHVADKVPFLISMIINDKGVRSDDLLKMSCPEFCSFVVDATAQQHGKSDRQSVETGDVDKSTHAHSPDFRSVQWFDTNYSFTANQAKAVKLLYENYENGTPDVGDETLLSAVDPNAPPARLNVLFRDHPAWGTMIVAGGSKGSHRLAEPTK